MYHYITHKDCYAIKHQPTNQQNYQLKKKKYFLDENII